MQALRPEAAAYAAKLEAEFLARQTAFYSRQLALTSRQHARYVTSVAAAVGEQRGPPIVPHAALSKAALPFAVAAEIMPADRPSSLSGRVATRANVSSALHARQVESTEDAARSTSNGCTQPEQGQKLLQQQVSYQTNLLKRRVTIPGPILPQGLQTHLTGHRMRARLLTPATRSQHLRYFTRPSR